MISTTPDFTAVKAKQNAAWASGDYARIGATLQIVGESLADAMDPTPGMNVLDVAAGNGNATLAMARIGTHVTSTDYVDSLLARGRTRAEADGLDVTFELADAEALPFQDNSFDQVVSTFGVMFAPDQHRAASEMLRVCKPGGKIGLANWTASSFIGQLFKVLGRHVPPPAGVQSPARWGDNKWLHSVFQEHASSVSVETCRFVFRYRSPVEFLEVFRNYYGPVHKAFLAVEPGGASELERDILATIDLNNTSNNGSMRVPSEYAQVIVTKS